MKMDYRRDLQHNYLVVETGEKTENYITRMMTENQVQGLLGCECRRMDQKKLYYFQSSTDSVCSIFPGAGQYDRRSGCYRSFSDGGCILYGRQPAESVFHRGTAFRSSEYLHRYPAGTQ